MNPPGGNRRNGRHGRMKVLVFTMAPVVLFFTFLEVFLRITGFASPPAMTTVRNPLDPEGRSMAVGLAKGDYLGGAVLYNLVKNPLTYPDPDYIFRVRPDAGKAGAGGYSGINSLGFRGEEFETGAGKRKIAVFGDSCAFGWGLKDYRDTFPYLMEEKLSHSYRVYNFAQPGFSTTQGLLLYREWMRRLDPEVVILYFGWNDIWPTPLLTDRQTLRMLKVSNNSLVRAMLSSRTASLMGSLFRRMGLVPQGKRGGRQPGGTRRLSPRVPPEETVENLSAMTGAATTIIIAPPFSGAAPEEVRRIVDLNRAVKESLKDAALFPELAAMRSSASGSAKFYQSDGYHPNRLGADYMAAGVAELVGKK